MTEDLQKTTYTLFNPTGNITLLAETPVPTASQPSVAAELMALEPETEQAGFVAFGSDAAFLRMAGGEFCGNAAMSAAAMYLERSGKKEGTVPVYVSGTKEAVAVRLAALPDSGWRAAVTMPRPESVGEERFPDGARYPAVHFPGIVHVILEEEIAREEAEALAPALCAQLKADALGLMFLNREEESLTPLVYVPAAGTLCWETACASGTTAVGAYFAAKTGHPVNLRLKQPGGVLEIDARPDGGLILTGTVRILRSAEANLPVC